MTDSVPEERVTPPSEVRSPAVVVQSGVEGVQAVRMASSLTSKVTKLPLAPKVWV
jgi:alanine dehydrogenase